MYQANGGLIAQAGLLAHRIQRLGHAGQRQVAGINHARQLLRQPESQHSIFAEHSPHRPLTKLSLRHDLLS